MMEEADVKSCSIRKFREDLQSEYDRLTSLCESWENTVNVVGNIPDDIKVSALNMMVHAINSNK